MGVWIDEEETVQAAFLHANGKTVDLESLIPADTGWSLVTAVGINDAGQIIGNGFLNDQACGYILTPIAGNSFRVPDLVTQLLLGAIAAGGGGIGILPSGVNPVGPRAPLVWDSLSKHKQDALIALAMDEFANAISDPAARRALRNSSLDVVRSEIELLAKEARQTLNRQAPEPKQLGPKRSFSQAMRSALFDGRRRLARDRGSRNKT